MADDISMSLDTTKLIKALDEMPQKMQRKHLRAGVKAGAAPILAAMQARCPVQHETPGPKSNALGPGVLKASLRTKLGATKTGYQAAIGAPPATGHVAYWVEKGFDHTGHGRKRNRKKTIDKATGKVKHIPGTYFMTGAVDEAGQRAVDALADAIADSIEQG